MSCSLKIRWATKQIKRAKFILCCYQLKEMDSGSPMSTFVCTIYRKRPNSMQYCTARVKGNICKVKTSSYNIYLEETSIFSQRSCSPRKKICRGACAPAPRTTTWRWCGISKNLPSYYISTSSIGSPSGEIFSSYSMFSRSNTKNSI